MRRNSSACGCRARASCRTLANELLRDASESCRIEGERSHRRALLHRAPLAPAQSVPARGRPGRGRSRDHRLRRRRCAISRRATCFPGDLLLKNFGVTSHGRVIFYDYDELCLVSDCVFRDLPQPRCEEEEASAEPWFHCGPNDVFPEQWLQFLSIPKALEPVFSRAPRGALDRCLVARHGRARRRGSSARPRRGCGRRRGGAPRRPRVRRRKRAGCLKLRISPRGQTISIHAAPWRQPRTSKAFSA